MRRVTVFNAHRRYRIARKPIAGYVRGVLAQEGVRKATVAVVFVDSPFIRKINHRFLHHDEVTDVISFPMDGGSMLEGEIYVCLDQAKRQARQAGVRFSHEVARLVIHGALHLAGYTDVYPADAAAMRGEEDKHLFHWFR